MMEPLWQSSWLTAGERRVGKVESGRNVLTPSWTMMKRNRASGVYDFFSVPRTRQGPEGVHSTAMTQASCGRALAIAGVSR